MKELTLQIFHNGHWWNAATLKVENPNHGREGAAILTYNLSFLTENTEAINKIGSAALSCNYPPILNPEGHKEEKWHSFLMDIMPSGDGRKSWITHLKLLDSTKIDWELLKQAGFNPIGNVRVQPENIVESQSTGFKREEVIAREERFIKYAAKFGAPIYGSSGAGGESPKYLLAEDRDGYFHADMAVDDKDVVKSWLVKYPRDNTQNEKLILKTEWHYYQLAKIFGLNVGADLGWEGDALFVPRFDRKKRGNILDRYGVETLYSLIGISDYGIHTGMERLFEILIKFSSQKDVDAREFLARDLLSIALGNTDNHGRNTSVIKTDLTNIRLSPLYDFAPMFLAPINTIRVNQWDFEKDDGLDVTGLAMYIAEKLNPDGPDYDFWAQWFKQKAGELITLPEKMRKIGIAKEVIDKRMEPIDSLCNDLEKCK